MSEALAVPQGGAPTAPPASAPAVAPPVPAAPAQATQSPPSPPSQPAAANYKVLGEDDDDIPDGETTLALTPKALKARIARSRQKYLVEKFGGANPEEVKAKLAKLAELEAKEEEQRLASMTELDRHKELAARAQEERDAAVQALAEYKQSQAITEQDRFVSGIAGRYFVGKYADFAVRALKHYIQELPDEEVPDESQQGAFLDGWFAQFAHEHPEICLKPVAPETPAVVATPVAPTVVPGQAPAPVVQPPVTFAGQQVAGSMRPAIGPPRAPLAQPFQPYPTSTPPVPMLPEQQPAPAMRTVPISNGAQTPRPVFPMPGPGVGPKTAAPNRANSMTDAEWRQFKREKGINY